MMTIRMLLLFHVPKANFLHLKGSLIDCLFCFRQNKFFSSSIPLTNTVKLHLEYRNEINYILILAL